jgi:hypothetical protein
MAGSGVLDLHFFRAEDRDVWQGTDAPLRLLHRFLGQLYHLLEMLCTFIEHGFSPFSGNNEPAPDNRPPKVCLSVKRRPRRFLAPQAVDDLWN